MNKYVYVITRKFGQKNIVAVFDSEEKANGYVMEYENKRFEQGKSEKPLLINKIELNKSLLKWKVEVKWLD